MAGIFVFGQNYISKDLRILKNDLDDTYSPMPNTYYEIITILEFWTLPVS